MGVHTSRWPGSVHWRPVSAAGLFWLGALGAGAAPVAAQAPPAPATTQPTSAPGYIGLIPYSDPTFGFELRVPAGWSYDRARYPGPEGSIGILRGNNRATNQLLQVFAFRSPNMPAFPEWLDEFLVSLGKAHGGRKIPQHRWSDEISERATLMVDTKLGGTRTITYYLCVPFDSHTVCVVLYAGAVAAPADEERLKTEFDEIAGSLRVQYDPVAAEAINAAFERGRAVLEELHAGAASVPLDGTERAYEIRLAEKSIGYLSRTCSAGERPGSAGPAARQPGLWVHEESWRFADDGTVRHARVDAFSSHDFRTELIENRQTQLPAADVVSQRLYIELDQCVREGNTLVSSFSTNLDVDLPEPQPPIPTGPRYLDLAWVRLLPELLLRAPAELYAFAIYDTQTRALVAYLIQPLGECELPDSGGARGYGFEAREGLVAPPSRMYTDLQGKLVRIEAGDLVLVSVPVAQVERTFGAQRDAARRRLEPPARPHLPP